MADFRKEDAESPACACGNSGSVPGGRINLVRVRDRLDALEASGDSAGALRLLDYWLAEARANRDQLGEILIENEYVGFHRKAGEGGPALSHGERALRLLSEYGLEGTVAAGTTRINLATACTAFGKPETAWALFREAREIYEKNLPRDDSRLGGLYNNMALCAASLGLFPEGKALYADALRIMEGIPHGEGEMAITCLNLADLISAESEGTESEEDLVRAAEETERLVDRAWQLLNTPDLPRNAWYRFICEKCAPVMAHYGRLEEAKALSER